jgi:hypothetical protein
METRLDIHGVKVLVKSDDQVAEWVRHDYGYYLSDQTDKPSLAYSLAVGKPEYPDNPEISATKYHEDYIVYDARDIRLVDFFGEALAVYHILERAVDITCTSADRLYEIFRLSFDSLLGEELDRRGLHRIHCLGLEKGGFGTVILMPPGAGKSTLALKFLNAEGIGVLAEDIALYDQKNLLGLHFRWGVRGDPGEHEGRLMRRIGRQDKNLISTKGMKLPTQARPRAVILGLRTMSRGSSIRRVGRIRMAMPLFKSMVLGLELQQSLAYFLLRNYKDGFSKAGTGLSRLGALISLLAHSKTYEFSMGYDVERNFRTLKEFMDSP